MSRPTPTLDPSAYLAREQDWLAHLRACQPCRLAVSGLPQCRAGVTIWKAMRDAYAALEAAANADDLTACAF